MTNKVFYIGDSHSNYRSVIGLLKQVGICGGDGKRIDFDTFVVHNGDLANCVLKSRDEDLRSLALVGDIIDLLLLGNHEAPYFNITSFNGFFHYPEIKEKLFELEERGLIKIAYAVLDDPLLLSHAGLNKSWQSTETANEAAKLVNYAFKTRQNPAVLTAVGVSRGGWGEGGILWADWSEGKTTKFTQIVGHSAGDGIRCKNGKHGNHYLDPHSTNKTFKYGEENLAFCIDIGCNKTGFYPKDALAGCWIDPNEKTLEFVIYNP